MAFIECLQCAKDIFAGLGIWLTLFRVRLTNNMGRYVIVTILLIKQFDQGNTKKVVKPNVNQICLTQYSDHPSVLSISLSTALRYHHTSMAWDLNYIMAI